MYCISVAFDVDHDTESRISHRTRQSQFGGGRMDERPEAHPLDYATNDDTAGDLHVPTSPLPVSESPTSPSWTPRPISSRPARAWRAPCPSTFSPSKPNWTNPQAPA